MLKTIAKCIAVISLFLATTTQALPIVQADAFNVGDNKAALETNTGLLWMDFGVNAHLSYDNVRQLLPTEFAGWRLPTAAEVDHLWTSLFADLPEWNRSSPSVGSLGSSSHTDYFNSIIDVFGQNPDTTFFTLDADGNMLESWTVKNLFAVFMDESGVSGYVSMSVPYDPIYPNTAFYMEFDTDVSGWYSALLVKDTATVVPEPGSLFLMLLAMVALVVRNRRMI